MKKRTKALLYGGLALLGAFGLRLLPGKYIGLLGLVPMGLGIKAAIDYFRERKNAQAECEAECFKDGSDTNKADEEPHLQKQSIHAWPQLRTRQWKGYPPNGSRNSYHSLFQSPTIPQGLRRHGSWLQGY